MKKEDTKHLQLGHNQEIHGNTCKLVYTNLVRKPHGKWLGMAVRIGPIFDPALQKKKKIEI